MAQGTPAARSAEATADRRVVITALVVMVALVVFGVGFGSLFAATNCRQLRPIELDVSASSAVPPATVGSDVAALLAAQGVDATVLAATEQLLGPATVAIPLALDGPIRITLDPAGVLVTGDGALLVGSDGRLVAGVGFRRPITVVGDGSAVYALVVGNSITGQVDALRPLLPGADGFTAGTCVDTSAVGSPLSFLHDARDGNLLGLRTDEDGSEAVLELRDPTRGRVWATVIELPRAPAGLQGSRTSGAIGPDTVVMARRIGVLIDDPSIADQGAAVQGFARSDGTVRWTLTPDDVRAALPDDLADVATLRLEVAHIDDVRALITVGPDVAADALLPLPVHGPLGRLGPPDPRTVTLEVELEGGRVLGQADGSSSIGRDGPDREATRAGLLARGLDADDVLSDVGRTWVLLGRLLVRFG